MPAHDSIQGKILRLDARDNVLVALADLPKGEIIRFSDNDYLLLSGVPAKHKFLTQDLAAGDDVIMYGVLVGKVTQNLQRGELLTTRNIRHAAASFHKKEGTPRWTPPEVSPWLTKRFLDTGGLMARSVPEIIGSFVPLVFCENRNHARLETSVRGRTWIRRPSNLSPPGCAACPALPRRRRGKDKNPFAQPKRRKNPLLPESFRNVDGIKFLAHEGGCGGTREDSNNLCALLAGYIHHPNVAGATVLSLGCQHAQIPILLEEFEAPRSQFQQAASDIRAAKKRSEAVMISQAIRDTFLGLVEADKFIACRRRFPTYALASNAVVRMDSPASPRTPPSGTLPTCSSLSVGSEFFPNSRNSAEPSKELIDRCVSEEVSRRFMQLMRDLRRPRQQLSAPVST